MTADFTLEHQLSRDNVGCHPAFDDAYIGCRFLIDPTELDFGYRLGGDEKGTDPALGVDAGVGSRSMYIDPNTVGSRSPDNHFVDSS